MQSLSDLIFLIEAVETIFMNPQCALLYHYFQQSFESDDPAV